MTAKRRWMVDKVALADACDHIGLTYPVRVDVRKIPSFACGQYYGWKRTKAGVLTHVVKLNGEAVLYEAQHALWHELGHALQLERLYETEPKARQMGPIWAWGESQRRYHREMRALGISDTAFDAGDWERSVYLQHSEEAEAEDLADRMAPTWPLITGIKARRQPTETRLINSELFA